MKKYLVIVGLLFITAAATNNAQAAVTGLKIKFAGGCLKANTSGACVIKATASGTELSSSTVQLLSSTSSRGNYRALSPRVHSLSANGFAAFSFKNVAGGCFIAVTRKNPGGRSVRSRAICE
jgi:hypothetical protein